MATYQIEYRAQPTNYARTQTLRVEADSLDDALITAVVTLDRRGHRVTLFGTGQGENSYDPYGSSLKWAVFGDEPPRQVPGYHTTYDPRWGVRAAGLSREGAERLAKFDLNAGLGAGVTIFRAYALDTAELPGRVV